MKSITIIAAVLMLISRGAYSQSRCDSAICRFLVEKQEIAQPINTTIKVKDGSYVKNTNYYLERKPAIRLSAEMSIQPVVFGCYKTHAAKYLLVEVDKSAGSSFYFYGNDKLMDQIDKLKQELLQKEQSKLHDEDVASIISYLLQCYL